MKCPICDNVTMREVEKDGVQVDICPECKGVWLDRGELEKLMSGLREVRQQYNQWEDNDTRNGRDVRDDREYRNDRDNRDKDRSDYRQTEYSNTGHNNYPPKYKKKKTMLDVFGDLFD